MSRHHRAVLVCATAALIVAACVGTWKPGATATAVPNAAANGKAIFLTGRDLGGVQISASPRPLMPNCAACHHANGSGGVRLPGGAVSADLRHRALVTTAHPPYTLRLLERAISTGVDNTGHALSPVMPRWRMSRSDLQDVAHYVLTALQ
jgi:mono/diheme cytochrome c family protein